MKIERRPILILLLLALIPISLIINCSDKGNQPRNPTENLPPTVPTVIYPQDGATDVPIDAILQWESSDPENESLRYDIYFGIDSTQLPNTSSWLFDSYPTLSPEQAAAKEILEQVYQMQMTYHSEYQSFCLNGMVSSAGDSMFYENLGVVPAIGNLYTYSMVSSRNTFTCTAVANLDHDAECDIWCITQDSDTTGPENIIIDIAFPYYANEVYWKVIAYDSYNNRTEGPVWYFRTANYAGGN